MINVSEARRMYPCKLHDRLDCANCSDLQPNIPEAVRPQAPVAPEPPPTANRFDTSPPKKYKIADNPNKDCQGRRYNGKYIYKKQYLFFVLPYWDKIGQTHTLEEAIKFVEKYKAELCDSIVYLP